MNYISKIKEYINEKVKNCGNKVRGGLVALLFATISTLSCGDSIKEGSVCEKVYEPERKWVQLMPIQIGKVTQFIPFFHYDDEDYIIRIKNGESKNSFYVDKERYEKIKVGDWFVFDENKDEHDDEIVKRKATAEEKDNFAK